MAFFSDRGAPHSPYFANIQEQLKLHGSGIPELVLDLDRLDQNIKHLNDGSGKLRIVVKSLPSIELLRYITRKLGTYKFMIFHAPHIVPVLTEFPEADILLGKPLPGHAILVAHHMCPTELRSSFAKQVTWLADDLNRIEDLARIAEKFRHPLRVALEIDIGMRRGGFRNADETAAAARLCVKLTNNMRFSGFMGYDAHVPKSPWPAKWHDSFAATQNRYRIMVEAARASSPELFNHPIILNGAGSLTVRSHQNQWDSPTNDWALGSALVLPGDFMKPELADLNPCAFIAAPVLKRLPRLEIPYISALSRLWARLDPNRAHVFFIYGGYWKAKPVSPRGISYNPVYGHSSNQEMLNGSSRMGLAVDDYVFFQPNQSEAVLAEFGEILALRPGQEVPQRWSVLSANFPNFSLVPTQTPN